MIISQTPFRISFFGGGTDYPAWFNNYPGAVFGMAIDKYCYVVCKPNLGYFEHKTKVSYSQLEYVHDNENIGHPAIRECLRFCGLQNANLELYHVADLPAKKGLGSSSAFVVGLINAFKILQGKEIATEQLALDAIFVEQQMIKEHVGCQDQFHSALGRIHHILFSRNGIQPIEICGGEAIEFLLEHLMLFDTGFYRLASEIITEQLDRIQEHESELMRVYELVELGIQAFLDKDIDWFGYLLDESWKLKRNLSSKITNPQLDSIYESAIRAGALGGKLLGAGGGGYMLFVVKPEHQKAVREALAGLMHIPFGVDYGGSQIIFKDSS